MPSRRRARTKNLGTNLADVQRRMRYLERRPVRTKLQKKVVTAVNIAPETITADEVNFGTAIITTETNVGNVVVDNPKDGLLIVSSTNGSSSVYSDTDAAFIPITDTAAQATADTALEESTAAAAAAVAAEAEAAAAAEASAAAELAAQASFDEAAASAAAAAAAEVSAQASFDEAAASALAASEAEAAAQASFDEAAASALAASEAEAAAQLAFDEATAAAAAAAEAELAAQASFDEAAASAAAAAAAETASTDSAADAAAAEAAAQAAFDEAAASAAAAAAAETASTDSAAEASAAAAEASAAAAEAVASAAAAQAAFEEAEAAAASSAAADAAAAASEAEAAASAASSAEAEAAAAAAAESADLAALEAADAALAASSAIDEATAAKNSAIAATESANKKNSVFRAPASAYAPATAPTANSIGDVWFDTTPLTADVTQAGTAAGGAKPKRWNGTAWEPFGLSYAAITSLDADTITAGTLTGRTVRTSASGNRIELADTDVLKFWKDDATLVGTIQPGLGNEGLYITAGSGGSSIAMSGSGWGDDSSINLSTTNIGGQIIMFDDTYEGEAGGGIIINGNSLSMRGGAGGWEIVDQAYDATIYGQGGDLSLGGGGVGITMSGGDITLQGSLVLGVGTYVSGTGAPTGAATEGTIIFKYV